MTQHTCTAVNNVFDACPACLDLFQKGQHWSQRARRRRHPGPQPENRPMIKPNLDSLDPDTTTETPEVESTSPLAVRDSGEPVTTKEIAQGLAAISRVTDALAARVSQSGRHSAEDQLDREIRTSLEEDGGRQHSVQCDRCGLKGPGAGSPARASELALERGWFVSDEKDHCPTCRDDRKLLPGQVAGQALDVLPREVSVKDQIFMTRIEWIADRIESGATPVASIVNARRSGHRAMLTDLARAFGYDVGKFLEHVQLLIDSGDLNDELWLRAADSSAGEGFSGVEYVFMKRLFELLKTEDDA